MLLNCILKPCYIGANREPTLCEGSLRHSLIESDKHNVIMVKAESFNIGSHGRLSLQLVIRANSSDEN